VDRLSVVREIRELKNQIAYAKNLGFFLGAGTSCALGIPNIEALTAAVEKALPGPLAKCFSALRDDIKGAHIPNIEEVLNHTRRIREITKDEKGKAYLGVCGLEAKELDLEICRKIFEIITEREEKADLSVPSKFLAWLSLLGKDRVKEIFTSNYDLVIERALEATRIPYFDGFVGSYEPFFWQESISQAAGPADITVGWLRVWKIHGSLNWFWSIDPKTSAQKITRVGKFDKAAHSTNELVIYPSKEKYDSSRKQPFVAYFDRLQSLLSSGELLFFVVGYSFSDQHINDVILNALRSNKRLACVVFCFKDDEVERLHSIGSAYLNLSAFGPTRAISNGTLFEWWFDKGDLKDGELADSYFDEKAGKVKLGDFRNLVDFLLQCSGRTDPLGPHA
jgi:hypothetical protein